MPGRRSFARLVGSAVLVGLAGCSGTGDDGSDALDPTTTETTTTTVQHETTFETLQMNGTPSYVPVVEGGHGNTDLELEVSDEDGLDTLEVLLEGPETDRDDESLKVKEYAVETGQSLGKTLRIGNELFQPGENKLKVKSMDTNGTVQTRVLENNGLKLEDNGYRIHLRDKTGALGETSGYTTERRWDDAVNKMTNAEWMDIYWNDRERMHGEFSNVGMSWSDIEDELPDSTTAYGKTTEEKIKTIVESIGKASEKNGVDSSGAGYDIFYPAERKIAEEKFNWGPPRNEQGDLEDKFFTTNIRAGRGNHKVIGVFFEDDHGDWQLRYHDPWWKDDSVLGEFNFAYGKPENTDYRQSPIESGRIVDAFNTSKMNWLANNKGTFDLEDLHSNAASSLARMADGALNDVDPETMNTVFELSYLKDLEHFTTNENFDRRVLENLIDAGRQLHTVYQELDEDEYLGVGGELGDEKFYKLIEEDYQKGLDSFEYAPDDEEMLSESALDNIESELLSAS